MLAAGHHEFLAGCGTSADAKVCGCIWDEMRGYGVESYPDLQRIERQMERGRIPGWMNTVIAGCRP